MRLIAKASKYRWHYLLACAMVIGCSSSAIATSRVGTAEVTTSNGVPCFSIPLNAETKKGLPLRGIVVSEIQTGDWNKLPAELWHFVAADPGARSLLRPQNCIRYGEAPASSIQRTFKPLEHFRIYYVNVNARGDDSSMIGYVAKFCIKPDTSGNVSVQVISPDERMGDKRYEVCVKPK